MLPYSVPVWLVVLDVEHVTTKGNMEGKNVRKPIGDLGTIKVARPNESKNVDDFVRHLVLEGVVGFSNSSKCHYLPLPYEKSSTFMLAV